MQSARAVLPTTDPVSFAKRWKEAKALPRGLSADEVEFKAHLASMQICVLLGKWRLVVPLKVTWI